MSKNLFAHLLHCLLLLRHFFFFYLKWVPKLDSVHIQCCSLSFLPFFRKGLLLYIMYLPPSVRTMRKATVLHQQQVAPLLWDVKKRKQAVQQCNWETCYARLIFPLLQGIERCTRGSSSHRAENVRAKQKGLHARHIFFNRTLTRAGNNRGSCVQEINACAAVLTPAGYKQVSKAFIALSMKAEHQSVTRLSLLRWHSVISVRKS